MKNLNTVIILLAIAMFMGWLMAPGPMSIPNMLSRAYATATYINGSTDNQITVVMFDADGDPCSGLDTTLNLKYWEEGEAAIIGPTNMTQATLGTHADNTAIEIFDGMYVLYVPDIAFDGGVGKKVQFEVTSDTANVRNAYLEIQLDSARLLSSDLPATGEGIYNIK